MISHSYLSHNKERVPPNPAYPWQVIEFDPVSRAAVRQDAGACDEPGAVKDYSMGHGQPRVAISCDLHMRTGSMI